MNLYEDCTLDPVMPTSSSDDELASRFSAFFSREDHSH